MGERTKMKRRARSGGPGRREPVQGMSTETFVRGYKRHSQMNVNTINGARLSSYTCDRIEELYGDYPKSNNAQT